MKLLTFLTYLFYRYYDSMKSCKEIAYESAILALESFLFMNAMTVIAILKRFNIYSLKFPDLKKLDAWFIYGIFLLIGFFFFRMLIPKKKVIALFVKRETKTFDRLIGILCFILVLILFLITI